MPCWKSALIMAILLGCTATIHPLSPSLAAVDQVEADALVLAQKTDILTSLKNETMNIRSTIDERMARLREKLRSVQDRIADTKQPGSFPGQTSLEVQLDESGRRLSNEVQAKFKVGIMWKHLKDQQFGRILCILLYCIDLNLCQKCRAKKGRHEQFWFSVNCELLLFILCCSFYVVKGKVQHWIINLQNYFQKIYCVYKLHMTFW